MMEQMNTNSSSTTTISVPSGEIISKNYQKKYFDNLTSSSLAYSRNKVEAKTYNRAKIVLVTMYIVLALMLALCVTNFIVISSMASSIESSKLSYEYALEQNQALQNNIGIATDSSNIIARLEEAGYIEGSVNELVSLPSSTIEEIAEEQTQTNWFNEFTNFISRVFGGN